MLIDVDRLKALNDTFGHAVGNHALVHVAENIQDALPHVAGVVRSGPGRERADVHGQASLIVSASE